jgi:hypothetical protein
MDDLAAHVEQKGGAAVERGEQRITGRRPIFIADEQSKITVAHQFVPARSRQESLSRHREA